MIVVAPYNYVVYRDTQGAYHAVRVADGVTIATDPASATPVFQSVLNQDFLQDPSGGFGAGDIYVRPALYELGATFAGLNVRRYTRLTSDPTAILQVPSGYAGPVFIIAAINDAGVAYAEICGGIIREAQPNRNQWTAFRLQASPADGHQLGVLYNKIRDTVVFGPGVGLELNVTAAKGFINANRFEFIRARTRPRVWPRSPRSAHRNGRDADGEARFFGRGRRARLGTVGRRPRGPAGTG